MGDTHAPAAVIWFEIVVEDFARAAFDGGLLGWSFEPSRAAERRRPRREPPRPLRPVT